MRAKRSKKKVPPLLWRLLKRYLANTSIHGVRYLVEDGRHWTERLFWLVSCGLSWWGCTVMIYGVLNDFANRRTAVTVDTNYLDWAADLPSLHVCSLGTADSAKYILDKWKKKAYTSKILNYRTVGYHSGLPEPHSTKVFEGLAESLKLNCSEIFRKCEWNGNEIDCCKAFRPLATPIGSCLSINSIFTTHADSESGDYDKQTFRIRQRDPDSLRILFKKTAYWTAMFKDISIYLLDNTEIPTPTMNHDKKFANRWKTSEMTKIDVVQQSTYNDDGVRGVPVEKRNCRFINERGNLRIYRRYGYDACVSENKIWRLYDSCGCISHLHPRTSSMQVCNQTQLKCLSEANSKIDDLESTTCVADCEATIYTFFENFSEETAKEGACVHVNLLPGPTIRYYRYVVHSKLDVVVAVGSALGLFVGASILSLVEIPYWFIVRSIDDNDDDDDAAEERQQR